MSSAKSRAKRVPAEQRCHAILDSGRQCPREKDPGNDSFLCSHHAEIVLKEMTRDEETVERINRFKQAFAKMYPDKRLPDVEALAYSERAQKLLNKYPRLSIEAAIRFVYEGKKLPADEV
jgi:hypothetical protein